ncbi:MAG: alpha/beta fold hydrolase [bacterium]
MPHLNYEESGDGTPLLLIHGFPLDRTMWRPQLDELSKVARVIAPDLRGFGAVAAGDGGGDGGTGSRAARSDAAAADAGAEEDDDESAVVAPFPETLTMDDYASDLAFLLARLDVERVVLCGLSMGGYVAMAFLARYPTAVRGLILANTRAGADNEAARAARLAGIERARTEGVGAIADGMMPKMLAEATRTKDPELVASVRAMMARQTPDAVAAALRGMIARPDRTEWLASVRVPTLVITSEADTLIPPSESEAIARGIPGARLATLSRAAHLSNLENPTAFNAVVRDFVPRT